MIYLLDTTTVSDLLVNHPQAETQLSEHLALRHVVAICTPIHYEVIRGLLWKNFAKKLQTFEQKLLPRLDRVATEEADWLQAAQFWAATMKAGRQLSDMDLLLAAMAQRLDAIIVSSDDDFDALPVRRENWRL